MLNDHEKQQLDGLPQRKLRYTADKCADRARELAIELQQTLERERYARELIRAGGGE